VLQWDEPFYEPPDLRFNIFLIDPETSQVVDELDTLDARDRGNLEPLGQPFRRLDFALSEDAFVEVGIELIGDLPDGMPLPTLELYGSENMQFLAGGRIDAIKDHGIVPEVLTVGAIRLPDVAFPDPIDLSAPAIFSSGGRVTILGEATPRRVLDVMAVSNVRVSGAGGFPIPNHQFDGTSAAAPHVAAIAGLLFELLMKKNPTVDPFDLQASVVRSAIELGAVDMPDL
jgi:hypothetical protein